MDCVCVFATSRSKKESLHCIDLPATAGGGNEGGEDEQDFQQDLDSPDGPILADAAAAAAAAPAATTTTMALITSRDVVRNPLYGQPMVKAVATWEQWAPATLPLLHSPHSNLGGPGNTRAGALTGLATNR